jgi:hypothetical protein
MGNRMEQFMTTKPALQKALKGILHAEEEERRKQEQVFGKE